MTYLTKLDVFRHVKSLHQMASKKYGLDPSSHSYGYSVDYSVYPPILDVFKIKGEPFEDDEEDEDHTEEMERQKEEARLSGGEPYLYRTALPVGKKVFVRTAGRVEPDSAPFWSRKSEIFESIKTRPPGVDADGNKLQVTPDVTDILLAGFPPEMRSGDQLCRYWKNAGSNYGSGNVTLVTKISQSLDALFAIAGSSRYKHLLPA